MSSPHILEETVKKDEKRKYAINSVNKVSDHYRMLRTKQTIDYVHYMHNKYFTFNTKFCVWDALELLNTFIDTSDPDLVDVPNIHHAFQTAEGLRKDGYPDYIQLVGLIHDLGKMIFFKGCDTDGTSITNQYGVGGDTFIVGCKLSNQLVLPEYNSLNPDMKHPVYSEKFGIYEKNCGFDKCLFSFGHDEYLYQVLIYNRDILGLNITLPEDALYIIRYHSFYPWHKDGAYSFLANEYDKKMKIVLKEFSMYDLYTKSYELFDDQKISELKEYYTQLMIKYFGGLELTF